AEITVRALAGIAARERCASDPLRSKLDPLVVFAAGARSDFRSSRKHCATEQTQADHDHARAGKPLDRRARHRLVPGATRLAAPQWERRGDPLYEQRWRDGELWASGERE